MAKSPAKLAIKLIKLPFKLAAQCLVYGCFGFIWCCCCCCREINLCGTRTPRDQFEAPLRTARAPIKQVPQATAGSQDQSLLFAKLPAEVRLLIWQCVLGAESDSDVLHIDIGDGIIKYRRCRFLEIEPETDTNSMVWNHGCWLNSWAAPHHQYCHHRAMLPLLLTCKQIYHESIEYLYTRNTFDFRRSEAILRLPDVIPANRLELVRRVHISTIFWAPFYAHSERDIYSQPYTARWWNGLTEAGSWPSVCSLLDSLPGLEHLHIEITMRMGRSDFGPVDTEDALLYILKPLQCMTIKDFKVTLTEPLLASVDKQLGPRPYQLYYKQVAVD